MLKKIPIALICAAALTACTHCFAENVIYETDFSAKDSKWNVLTGEKFNISNGKLNYQNRFTDMFASIIKLDSGEFENGHVSFDLTLSDSRDFSLLYRMEDENSYYKLTFAKNKITVTKRINGGNEIFVAGKAYNFDTRPLHIDLALLGVDYRLSVNGEEILYFKDSALTEGDFAFWAKKATAQVDNFKLYEVEDEVISENDNKTEPIEIFVSNDGNDETGKGTKEQPYKTFAKAKEMVRIAKSQHRPINVTFAGGEYHVTDGLVFTEEDSGEKVMPITYRAAEGEKVIFTGAKSIDSTKFELVTDENMLNRMYETVRGKVYQVDLGAQGFTRDDVDFERLGPLGYQKTANGSLSERTPGWDSYNLKLFVNDRLQSVSRWPNSGYATIYDAVNGDLKNNDPQNRCKIYFNNEEPLRWVNAKHAVVSGNMSSPYFRNEAMIEKVDLDDMSLTLGHTEYYGVKAGMDYSVMNLIEEIDIPGEWYVDYDTMILYYYPEKEITADDEFEMPYMQDTFITLENGVQYLNFENLEFEKTNTKIGSYEGETASGFYVKDKVDNINIKGCAFRDIGGIGVSVRAGSDANYSFKWIGHKNFNIDSCDFIRCFRYAFFGGSGYFGGIEPADYGALTIKNCYFYDTFLRVNGSYGNIITNNLFSKRYGEFITWSSVCGKFNYNECSYGVYGKADMGCVYSGRSPTSAQGQEVSYNLIHHYGPTRGFDIYSSAIYYDDHLCGNRSYGNMLMAKTKDASGVITTGWINSGGADQIFKGNISVNAVAGYTLQNRKGMYGSDGTEYNKSAASTALFTNKEFVNLFPWVSRYTEYTTKEGVMTKLETNALIENNIAVNCTQGTDKQGYEKAPYPTGVNDDAIEINDTSIFVDYDNLDLRITKEAKEKYNLSDDYPCEDNFDINDVGIQRDIEYNSDLQKFNITAPINGEITQYCNDIQLAWQFVDGAEEYEYIIASDREFKDVVTSGKTTDTSAEVTVLEQNKEYYLKVIARSYARTQGFEIENANGAISFKTSQTEKTSKAILKQLVEKIEAKLAVIKESNKIGDYKTGTKKYYKNLYNEAMSIINNANATEQEVNAKAEEIISVLANDNANMNIGFAALDINTNYETVANAEVKNLLVKKGEAAIETADKAASVTFKKTLSNNEIQCFKVKTNFESGFVMFALRHNDPNTVAWAEGSYYALVKQDAIELQCKGTLLKVVPNDIFTLNEWHDVRFGVLPTTAGLNLYFEVDGNVVFDYLYTNRTNFRLTPGYFNVYLPANATLELKTADSVESGTYKLSAEITDYIQNGIPTYFETSSKTAFTTIGTWEKTGFKANGISEEYSSSEKGAQAQWKVEGENKSIYKIYYYNNPSAENDNNVAVKVEGRSRLYEGTIDLTQGSEGWVELCEFEMTSDGGDTGYAQVYFTGSGNGKLKTSMMMVRPAK